MSAEDKVQDEKIADLYRRCAIKEQCISSHSIQLAAAQEQIKDLEEYKKTSDLKVQELQAWKNKLAGYVGAFVVIAGLLGELVRKKLFGS